MFYIFNKDNMCIASCSFEPDSEDLVSRQEFFIESEEKVSLGSTYGNGIITENKVIEPVDYELTARNYRNFLRNQLDNYLKPASTIDDELVIEDQKTTLINDSLLLARWPATTGWPYILLPELSELANTLLKNPAWTYPMEAYTDGN